MFALNDIFSEATAPSALKFDMKHCLVYLYQVCSVAGPGVQNYPVAGGGGGGGVWDLNMKYA